MIDTAQVATRSNSDMLRIERIAADIHRPSRDRVAEVARIVDEWRDAIDGTPSAATLAGGNR